MREKRVKTPTNFNFVNCRSSSMSTGISVLILVQIGCHPPRWFFQKIKKNAKNQKIREKWTNLHKFKKAHFTLKKHPHLDSSVKNSSFLWPITPWKITLKFHFFQLWRPVNRSKIRQIQFSNVFCVHHVKMYVCADFCQNRATLI